MGYALQTASLHKKEGGLQKSEGVRVAKRTSLHRKSEKKGKLFHEASHKDYPMD